MNKTDFMFNNLMDVWRIIFCIIICPLFGMVVGVALSLHHDKSTNAFLGAGAAVPVGYFLGLWWHIAATRNTEDKAMPMVLIVGLISLFTGYIVLFNEIPDTMEYMNTLNTLKSLQSVKISKITTTLRGTNITRTFSEPKIIAEFSNACEDLKGYSRADRRRNISDWDLTLYGEKNIKLVCSFPWGKPNEVVGYIMPQKERYYPTDRRFLSYNLRPWFEKYLMGANR